MARFGEINAQYFDDAGAPLGSGKLYFYESGTTTPKNTFSDINLTIPNTNPVILTAAGRQPNIFFNGNAKGILADKNDVQILVRDPIGETGTSFGDAWVATTIYSANSVVIGSDGVYYRSLANGNQNNNPTTTSGFWTLLYSVEWNAGITYQVGAVVTYDGEQYQSLQGSNLNQNPSTASSYWVLLSFAWLATATYSDGQNAVGTDGILYTSLQDSNTGNDPATSPAYWVGTSAAAAASATAAAASATAAAASETAAETAETNAETAQAAAEAAQAAAETAETNAETAETNAASSATAAAGSATAAATSATNAATSATNSASSATASAASATAALASETAAAASETAAAASESAAATSETNAANSATAAATSATNSANSATASASSATDSANSASAASTSASNAATSASNAATSATASAASAVAAAASYDAFDDRYLGDKASDPTLDNDGNALLTGALYFNTTSDVMKVYDGSAWNIAAISSASPTFTGTVTADGLSLGDNEKAQFGAGNDLEIYHNGSARIANSTGNLIISDTDGDIYIQAKAGENSIRANNDGSVLVYFDNAEKLATTSTGIDVTGTVTADGLTVNADALINSVTVGRGAGDVSTNTTVGNLALAANTSGANNVANGYVALRLNTTGSNNVATGSLALYRNTTGNSNVATGYQALYDNTDGDNNLATGYAALSNNTTGSNNVATGYIALLSNTTGSNNTALGRSAGNSLTTGSNNTVIGYNADASSATVSNETTIGNTSVTSTRIFGDISFYEDTGTTPKFFWDASAESLGIGTSSPASYNAVADNLVIGTTSGSNGLTIVAGTGNDGSIHFADGTSGADAYRGQIYYSHAGNYMVFGTNASERMRIDPNGNVGIGTSSPAAFTGFTANRKTLQIVNTTSGNGQLRLGTDAGLMVDHNGGGTTTSTIRNLYGATNAAAALALQSGIITLGTGTSYTERMRIDASGNLLVGTTSLNNGSEKIAVLATGSIGISVNRDANYYPVWFERSDVNVGNIFCTSVSTAFNTSSDQRLKENITDADDAGSKVDAIQVRQYDWKADGSHQDYGMVAQELLTVAPEAVHQPEDPEEMMGVDYSKLVPMLIKEIQSLRNRVATLEGI